MIVSLYPRKITPFFIYYKKLKHKNLKPLSTYNKACLSYVIPHGITDLFVYPGEISLFNYSYTFLFYNMYPNFIKYLFLMLFSVYHLRNDINGGIILKSLYTIGIHTSWIFFPEWSLSYLSWIHTTLHYFRLIKILKNHQKILILLLTSFMYLLLDNVNINDLNKEKLWIPLVIAHIINNN